MQRHAGSNNCTKSQSLNESVNSDERTSSQFSWYRPNCEESISARKSVSTRNVIIAIPQMNRVWQRAWSLLRANEPRCQAGGGSCAAGRARSPEPPLAALGRDRL